MSDTKIAVREKVNAEAAKLDTVVQSSMLAIQDAGTSHFAKALAVGRAYLDITAELTSQMKFVAALAGQANGFKTDKQYDEGTIKKCAIDALIAGVHLTGNQFNIIGGNMYIAQSGWKYKLQSLPGFSFIDVPRFSAPKAAQGHVEVDCEQSYVYGGAEIQTFKFTAFVRTNGGSNIDNNLGKAKAKLWHALFEKLTGEVLPGDDVEDGERVPLVKGSTISIASVVGTLSNNDSVEHPEAKTDKPDTLTALIAEIEKRAGLPTFYEQQNIDDMVIANMSKPARSKLCSAANAFLNTLKQDAGE